MRIVFIGSVRFSLVCLKKVLRLKGVQVVGVITLEKSPFNSDFASLGRAAEEAGIPCFFADDATQEKTAAWMGALKPDILYCFGWSFLLGKEILEAAPRGVIGYHPSALPENRGRHPVIWALALGLKKTASTFFFMNEQADAGDILSQKPVAIDKNDDASSLYEKLTSTATAQIAEFTPRLIAGTHRRVPQDASRASSWRKRGKHDGQIDWRMSAASICNLVRALTHPYPGAHCLYQQKEITIWKAEPVDFEQKNVEPGKVIERKKRVITIKCGEHAVRLLEHAFTKLPAKGEYL